ncbi:MAG: hypothetical protein IJM17_07165 [Firmicutes bacterium]|nr:hypothetical protein [Bacillota bacterium]
MKIMTKAMRRKRLIANTALALALLFVFWAFTGFDAVGKKAAFKKALKEALLPGMEPEIAVGTDGRISVLAEKDGVVYQAAVQKDRGPFYTNSPMVSETKKTGEVYIVPLRAYGDLHDSPEMAVKAEGERAELSIVLDEGGKEHPLLPIGHENGWFTFGYDREAFADRISDGEYDLADGEQAYEYLLSSPHMRSLFGTYSEPFAEAQLHGRWIFRSFDAEGNTVCEETRYF